MNKQLIHIEIYACPWCDVPPQIQTHNNNSYSLACVYPLCAVNPKQKNKYKSIGDAAKAWNEYVYQLFKEIAEIQQQKTYPIPVACPVTREEAEKILTEEGWLDGPCEKADPAHHVNLFLEGAEHGWFLCKQYEDYKKVAALDLNDNQIQTELLEALADYAHRAWSGWMEYLFSKSVKNNDGTVTIPKWAVERWERQMNTPYSDLTEKEKDSDRAEANEIIGIIRKFAGGK